MASFKQIQADWAQWLRDTRCAPPEGIEARRLAVYQRLLHNNIESFLERGFPVLAQVLKEQQWRKLVDDFIAKHRAKSPLFSKIGAEFVDFLSRENSSMLPDYTYQLAFYERMELDAFHCQQSCLPPAVTELDLASQSWLVNPSLQWGAFEYLVQSISAENSAAQRLEQPQYLVVYRVDEKSPQGLESQIKFMQVNAVTMLLLEQLQQQPGLPIAELSQKLSKLVPQLAQSQLEQGLELTIPDLQQRAVLFPAVN